MNYYTRKLIKPGDLNANNTLFGGALLMWIDQEAGIYAMTKLDTKKVVTKYISEITKKPIITINELVFVKIDDNEKPTPHHKTIDTIGLITS